MVFIRPTIVSTREDARRLAERRYGYVRQQQLDNRPNEEPSIDELVREYMGALPPTPPPALPGSTPPPAAPPQIIVPEVRSSTTTIQPVQEPRR
jgi:general secretion pathway protein D